MVSAFAVLGTSQVLAVDTERAIEAFVCELYEPGTATVHVRDLRWKLFIKKQLEAQKLPPTRGALHEAIIRAHYQAMVCIMMTCPTFSFHQQQAMAGKKKVID